MVFPAGRAKLQKNQTLSSSVQEGLASRLLKGLTNEEMRRIAILTPDEDGGTATMPGDSASKGEAGGGANPYSDLQGVMNGTNSTTMRAPMEEESGNSAQTGMPQQQPQDGASQNGWRFDPQTGEPLSGVDATKLMQFLDKQLTQLDPNIGVHGIQQAGQGTYKITVGPRQNGGMNKVVKP